MDSIEAARAVASLPLTVLLVMVLLGGYLEWWIYGTIHRARIAELNKQVDMERARANVWEGRFLLLNEKMDTMLRGMARIATSVDGTATVAAEKLSIVQDKLSEVRDELSTLKAQR